MGCGFRVHAYCGFVHNEDQGVVDEGYGYGESLNHPLAVISNLLVSPFFQPHKVYELRDPFLPGSLSQTKHLACELHQLFSAEEGL